MHSINYGHQEKEFFNSLLRGLAKSIPEIQMAGWIWIDFFMGSIFERISPALDQDTWGAADLWRKALSNWELWFR